MKKLLLAFMGFSLVCAGATFKVSSITATTDGYDIQIDYMSDEAIGGYQFDFLSDGALTLSAATGGASSDTFDGLTAGNNVVLAFSFSGSSLAPVTEYTHLVTLQATVNNGFDGQQVLLEAVDNCPSDSNCPSRLIVSDAVGAAVESDFHEASWTVGTDSFVLDNEIVSPVTFSLSDNYPNPFNPSTAIDFSVAELSFVNLAIYDASGRLVKTLVSESKVADSYSVMWDGSNDNGVQVSAGMYLYKITAGNFVETKKMLLVK